MTTVVNIHKDSFMFMSVSCTPLQIKCYWFIHAETFC